MPFFSPDGQWIGFFADGQLKKTSVAGGPTVAICDVRSPLGGSWAADDSILFSSGGGLASVSANGGIPRETTGSAPATVERSHRWPDMLPDGKSVLYTAWQDPAGTGNVNILSLETGEGRLLLENGTSARYVASGHIVFAREGALFAMPFDLERMQTSGAAIPVLEGVGWGGAGEAYFDVSDEGTLVYIAGQTKPETGLVSVNRKGESRPLGPRRRATWYGVELSPDDSSVVVAIEPQIDPPDLWVLDKARETLTRLTFSEARGNRSPVWSPDGRQIFLWAANNVASIEVDGSDRDLLDRTGRTFNVARSHVPFVGRGGVNRKSARPERKLGRRRFATRRSRRGGNAFRGRLRRAPREAVPGRQGCGAERITLQTAIPATSIANPQTTLSRARFDVEMANGCCAVPPVGSARISWISTRTSPMSRRRSFRSFRRHRRSNASRRGSRSFGSALQSSSLRIIAAKTSETSSPENARFPVNIS